MAEAPIPHLIAGRRTDEPADRAVDSALTASRCFVARGGAPHPAERADVLRHASTLLGDRSAVLHDAMAIEAGFTLADRSGELARAQITLGLCAEEATRLSGDVIPISSAPGVTDRLAFTIRRPLGVVVAITPFNSPVNTVLHKVGPALAAGNAVVIKPSELTPACALAVAEAIRDAGWPADGVHVVQGGGEVGAALVADSRVDAITFTGSTATGVAIQAMAGLRRTQLELGSLTCTIIDATADISEAMINACVAASFRKAGQVCTSIQRLYVHRSRWDQVVPRFLTAAGRLIHGDPRDDAVNVGPVVPTAAARLATGLASLRDRGVDILLGGHIDGNLMEPTVLVGPPDDRSLVLWAEEAFAPLVWLCPFDSIDLVIEEIEALPYGLATGVFTTDLAVAMSLPRRLRVGSVYVNDTSSARVDLMPYGGLKASGHGQEGPARAIRELTEETLVSISYRGRA